MAWERTFAMLKPDTVQRALIGPVLTRLEAKGFRIAALKLIQVSPDQAARHYAVHEGKPFYQRLVQYIRSSPVVVLVLEAPDAVAQLRRYVGATKPNEAEPGTIRGDYGLDISNNLIHASDSPENAALETAVYFTPDEILDYRRSADGWLVEEQA
ncbi:nucleoside-diphosphate kinase [bacterium]|nr:nucleoside-diphosphate kinase [bacterium]